MPWDLALIVRQRLNLVAVWIEQNGVTSSGSIEAAPRLFGNKVCDEKKKEPRVWLCGMIDLSG
jgi:hypothetical protein